VGPPVDRQVDAAAVAAHVVGIGGVAEISEAEAARLVAEAESLKGEAYAANSRCKLEERYRAARRVHEISDALRAAGKSAALQEVLWIMADLGALTIRPECEYLLHRSKTPGSYRSAEERAHGLGQHESYSARGTAQPVHVVSQRLEVHVRVRAADRSQR